MSEDIITRIQLELKGYLEADEYFVDVPVLYERSKDIANEVSRALGVLTGKASKLGVCAVIEEPTARDEFAELPYGPLNLDLTVLVIENPTLNDATSGTGKTAFQVARRVHRVIKHFESGGLIHAITPGSTALRPAELSPGLAGYEVSFTIREADSEKYYKVATPTFSYDAGFVALACATDGATIRFTETLSAFPSEAAGATLYSTPIAVAPGSIIRCAGYRSGWIASDVAVLVATAGGQGLMNESGSLITDEFGRVILTI